MCCFFYNIYGGNMKIYLDLLLILNFFLDLILLIRLSLILKRYSNFFNIILGCFIGSFSIFLLFMKLNSIELFLLKFLISLIMIFISFGFKDIKYFFTNLLFLYINSIILGGFLYFLNIQFSYKNDGLVFYYKGISINYIFLIIFSPIIIYIYTKQIKKLRNYNTNYYETNIYINKKILKYSGYLDTGNNLVDPITKKAVILINKNKIDIKNRKFLLVPFKGINNNGLIKCIKVSKIEVIGLGEFEDILLGIIEDNYKFSGIDVILNNKLLEDRK